jgi:CheY-like chemotaxis protein
LFASNPIDLVLLDYLMPGMDGAMVAREMKRLGPDIPIIMVSASPTAGTAASSVDAVLAKGQGPLVLFHQMEVLLKKEAG